MTPDELMIMTRIAVALETIASRIEKDAKAFDEMVQDGRSLAVIETGNQIARKTR